MELNKERCIDCTQKVQKHNDILVNFLIIKI